MLNWIKLTVIGIIIGASVTYHYVTLENVKEQYEQQAKDIANKVKEKEGEIILRSQLLESQKNEEIERINRRADELLVRLQQRTSRTENTNNNPSVGEACTGAQLYREDGEFLAREAARADRILEERNYYYEQYEQVRKSLNEFNKSN